MCGSACVFVLMAGVKRTIRPGSLVAVHSPQVSVTAAGRRYDLDPATNRRVVRGAEPILRSYAQHMGVSPSLIGVAHAGFDDWLAWVLGLEEEGDLMDASERLFAQALRLMANVLRHQSGVSLSFEDGAGHQADDGVGVAGR